ncbi:VOC family protein [Phenylobacterium sp.]|uniref:VOC family protein n=1 Tax=Phenylobacterium sp. TaxID=1871053 RepID=UPI00301E57AB
MITGLDHIAVVVRDLDAAARGYSRLLGLEADWIGSGGGVRQAWFQLENTALDLISPDGEGVFADGLRKRLETRGEGVLAYAFRTPDIGAAAKLLNRRGVAASPPAPLTMTAADGRTRTWTSSNLDPKTTGGLPLLLTEACDLPLSRETADAAVTRLDHVVVLTENVDRALAVYGAKLGLDLRLDRENPKWNARQLFFRCGDAVVEMAARIGADANPDTKDRSGGLAWRVADPRAAQARISAAGFDVSEVRVGRKPGTHVFTVRNAPEGMTLGGVPMIMLSAEPRLETA